MWVQIRAAKLTDAPLTSVALLPNGSTTPSHPLVLASSYDNKVICQSFALKAFGGACSGGE